MKEKTRGKNGKIPAESFIFFSLILIIILLFLFQSPAVKGKGQIVFPLIQIKYPYDIKILSLKVKEGQRVKKGDTLFSFMVERTPSLRLDYQKKMDKNDLERLLLEKENEKEVVKKTGEEEIKLLEKQLIFKLSERNYYNRIILEKQNEFEKMRSLNLLNVYTLPEIERAERFLENLKIKGLQVEEEIISLKSSIEKTKKQLQTEINNINEEIKKIKLQIKDMKIPENPDLIKEYKSPLTGKVDRIFVYNSEYYLAGQIIMNIAETDKLKVLAFFEQKYKKLLNPGRKVIFKLPDGTKLRGQINNIYLSTELLPPEFQRIRTPPVRNILVDIELENVSSEDRFYGMQGEVFLK